MGSCSPPSECQEGVGGLRQLKAVAIATFSSSFAPQEWVPIIQQDIQSQRKVKPQPPLSDAYLSGMPAKRRKVGLPLPCGSLYPISPVVLRIKLETGIHPGF